MPSSRKRRPRAVLDSNIWVSAAIWGGLPAKAVALAEEGQIGVLLTDRILAEVARILAHPRLRRIYEQAGTARDEILASIASTATFVKSKTRLKAIQEDDSDNRVLECALDGGAQYVVSGDRHLLTMRRFQGIRILSVRSFLRATAKPT